MLSLLPYYLRQGLRSLRRTPVLTGLMVLSIAMGIGAAMTTLTVRHLLSGDPLPGRSQHIYYPQIDATPSEEPRANPLDMINQAADSTDRIAALIAAAQGDEKPAQQQR